MSSGLHTNIAIFASGAGSNAKEIIEYFKDSSPVNVKLIVCNKPVAGVLQVAHRHGIATLLIEKNKFSETGYINELREQHIHFIVLAGFLWKIPDVLIQAYPHSIINIHPALLPAYGGKGMYGNTVHNAVLQAGDNESGITIHYVDDKYDHGEIILQKKCDVDKDDTVESLAEKIHALEHKYYPETIKKLVTQKK